MSLPQVVIVGRPNVGKSSLFNWLARRRLAIVDPTAGVTRDRMTQTLCEGDRYFDLVDTGGIGIVDADDLSEHVETQIETAIHSADLVLFVVDAQSSIMPLDEEVSRRLRPVSAPVILVVNKVDQEGMEANANEFFRLGYGEPVRCSVKQNRGRDLLVRALVEHLPEETSDNVTEPDEPIMKLAIVGRRNVGKSTFVNALAHEERMIVSEVPGTTRDSVDVRFEMDDKAFIAIDTPGLTRRKSIKTDLMFYSSHRANRSVRRADVVLLFFDAAQPIAHTDKQIWGTIQEEHKPCFFVVNKWDLYAGAVATDEWAQYLRDTFPSQSHVPIAFITAKTGKNVKTLVNHAQMLFRQARERISTSTLNKIVRAAIVRNPPPLSSTHRLPKIYYATQVDIQPPTIVLVCNEPAAFGETYRRYLLNTLRDALPFAEVPIKLLLRKRDSASGEKAAADAVSADD
ncbi:MAG: ribosome biogenesis GTPase Der [Pirellulales bacterium]